MRCRVYLPFRLRQHGTCHYLYFVFALYERKNEIQKKIKHRSAEGKTPTRKPYYFKGAYLAATG
jgi:hypothetical protein